MLKRTKKGFTLAELLIVVAIIAVLTAIAVPIFVTSLDKANQAVFQSNRDAVRSAGVAEALTESGYPLEKLTESTVIVATGTFDENGHLTKVVISKEPMPKTVSEPAGGATAATTETTYENWKDAKGTIVVWLTGTDLSRANS